MTTSRQFLEIKNTTHKKSDGSAFILTYSLVTFFSSDSKIPLYGISVSLQKAGCPPEEVLSPPISASEPYVRELITRIIRNKVTPLCLLEVLDECLGLDGPPDRA